MKNWLAKCLSRREVPNRPPSANETADKQAPKRMCHRAAPPSRLAFQHRAGRPDCAVPHLRQAAFLANWWSPQLGQAQSPSFHL